MLLFGKVVLLDPDFRDDCDALQRTGLVEVVQGDESPILLGDIKWDQGNLEYTMGTGLPNSHCWGRPWRAPTMRSKPCK
jgi:hypothetical protein